MSTRSLAKIAEAYSVLRRARDPRRRLFLATQLLEALGTFELTVSGVRDEAIRALRSDGASNADIAQLAGVNRSRAAQLAQRTTTAPGRRRKV